MFLKLIDTLNRTVVINVYDIILLVENYHEDDQSFYVSIRLKDDNCVTVNCTIETLIDQMIMSVFDSGEGIK